MPASAHDIYASAPMRDLLASEIAALSSKLQRCTGTSALQIAPTRHLAPPALPMLGHWVQLHVDGEGLHGDLSAHANEALPFLADAFALVLLRHATEVMHPVKRLLAEAARVVAPGGLLALTGLHPLSGWLPWWWQTRKGKPSLSLPMELEAWLRGADFVIERTQRVGPPWPGGASQADGSTRLFGGAYLILARKRRANATTLRMKPAPVLASTGSSGLAPGARRSATTTSHD